MVQNYSIYKCSEVVSFCFDKPSHTLYITDRDEKQIIAVNLETGTNQIICSKVPFRVTKAILCGDNIHIFGHYEHLVLSLILGYKHSDDHSRYIVERKREIDVVWHCQSRNSILLGGHHWDPLLRIEFAEYSLSTKEWKTFKCPSFSDEKIHEFGMVCSGDGRYIITFGGFDRDPPIYRRRQSYRMIPKDMIMVFDLNDETLKPKCSSLRCPTKGRFNALTMTDKKKEEITTFGFVRRCFANEELEGVQRLPLYIIQLIVKWVEMEYVHLLQIKNCGASGGHWKICIDDILESVI